MGIPTFPGQPCQSLTTLCLEEFLLNSLGTGCVTVKRKMLFPLFTHTGFSFSFLAQLRF